MKYRYTENRIIPSKLEVAPHALKMSEWVSGVEWLDTPETVTAKER